MIYYANPATRTCVISAECNPYFGVNSTHVCSSSCGVGQFANYNAYRCDACPEACVTCNSLTNCLSCITDSVSFNNFCYGYCNRINTTQMYFSKDNITCTAVCPNGTYASVVYCKLCDPSCANCISSATNCTTCASGLYVLNNVCLTSCPSGYKPDSSRSCVFCDTTCGEGLTYSTNVTNIDGQTSVYMNFNGDVNINGNLYNTFAITSNGKRLLQGSIQGYQIIVIDSQTVQFIFPPGTTYSDFNVQIINPQNVLDNNGNLPAQLVSQIMVDLNNIYSSSINNAPNSFPLYFTFLAIICVISFIFDL